MATHIDDELDLTDDPDLDPQEPEEKPKVRWTKETALAAARKSVEIRAKKKADEAAAIVAAQMDILDRRMENPQLYDEGKVELKLPGGPWTVRWVNTAQEGRYSRAIKLQGWVPVKITEIADKESIPSLTESPDGYASRGDRGKEILMRMPLDMYTKIAWRKAEKNKQSATGKGLKNLMINAAATRNPDLAEAASRSRGSVKDSVEFVPIDPSDGPPTD